GVERTPGVDDQTVSSVADGAGTSHLQRAATDRRTAGVRIRSGESESAIADLDQLDLTGFVDDFAGVGAGGVVVAHAQRSQPCHVIRDVGHVRVPGCGQTIDRLGLTVQAENRFAASLAKDDDVALAGAIRNDFAGSANSYPASADRCVA